MPSIETVTGWGIGIGIVLFWIQILGLFGCQIAQSLYRAWKSITAPDDDDDDEKV